MINLECVYTDVYDANERPRCLFNGLVMLLMVLNPQVIVFNRLIWIPPTILIQIWITKQITRMRCIDTYVGRGDLDAPYIRFYNLLVIT